MEDEPSAIRIPARRSAGVLQVTLLLPIGTALIWIAGWRVSTIRFGPSAISNRIIEYSWLFIALCIALAGLACLYVGLRWLLFAVWPARMGMTINAGQLNVSLGPFGGQRLDLARMTATYRFELSDEEQLSTEDYMDPDDEKASRLPILRHPHSSMTINRILESYMVGSEPQHCEQLKPLIGYLRRQHETSNN